MTGQAWLNGGTFAHGAAGPPMVYFSAYSSGSGQVTAVGPTTARFTVPPVSTRSWPSPMAVIGEAGRRPEAARYGYSGRFILRRSALYRGSGRNGANSGSPRTPTSRSESRDSRVIKAR